MIIFLYAQGPAGDLDTSHKVREWKQKNGHYHRSNKGGGQWEFFDLPEQWEISYGNLKFHLKPFHFKHTGLFPEQAVNWEWSGNLIREAKKKNPGKEIKVLNLFAYTGGATVACADAGAAVTHVDASKGMVTWAKENAAASGLANAPIRYLVDDCVKFVEREIRRGNHYDAIIMDPPSYGRGPKGRDLENRRKNFPTVQLCTKVLADKPLFFLINSYTTITAGSAFLYVKFGIKKPFWRNGLKQRNRIAGCAVSRDLFCRVAQAEDGAVKRESKRKG